MITHSAKVLLTGANGQLATAIWRAAPTHHQIIALGREALDICDENAVAKVLSAQHPDFVINGAAYNLVDKAETDREMAFRINHIGAQTLAQHCKKQGIPLLHFSTDFVFDGTKRTPYTENDPPHPQSIYAQSKLAGEEIVLQVSAANWVIRVSRLFGQITIKQHSAGQKPTGNFPLTMLKLAQTHSELRVVNDQIGTPSYTNDLAHGVWELVEKSDGGLFHLSNSGEVAFDEYARAIFEIAGINCKVHGISSAEYGAPATRPHYSTLNNEKAHCAGVTPLRNWRAALEEYLRRM